jgi:EAL domain-containing protein (putative c-di-GMP-specific phosphodiesterase class I)
MRNLARVGRQVDQVEQLLDGRSMSVLFQPIQDLRSRRVAGLEALCRFTVKPRRNPDIWFAMASAAGVGRQLQLLAVTKALDCLPAIPPDVFLALNLSPDAASSAEFRAILTHVPADRLVIEVTEHAPVWDYSLLKRTLWNLKAEGVRLAIDDVGAGYASLLHVLELAPDFVKLDMSLIRNIDKDSARRALAGALASFAMEIGADVIAEGIQTEEEMRSLRSLDVRYGQGVFLGPPARKPGRYPRVDLRLAQDPGREVTVIRPASAAKRQE